MALSPHQAGTVPRLGDAEEQPSDGGCSHPVLCVYLQVVAASPLVSGQEIHNTYGELSNCELLQKVGPLHAVLEEAVEPC